MVEVSKKFKIVREGQGQINRIGQRVARAILRPNMTYTSTSCSTKKSTLLGPGWHIYVTTALMNLATEKN